MRARTPKLLVFALGFALMTLGALAGPARHGPRGEKREKPSVRAPKGPVDRQAREVVRNVMFEVRKASARLRADLEIARVELEEALSAPDINEDAVMDLAERIGKLETELRKIQLRARIALVKRLGPERARLVGRILGKRGERRGPPEFVRHRARAFRRGGGERIGPRGLGAEREPAFRRGRGRQRFEPRRPMAGPMLRRRLHAARQGRPFLRGRIEARRPQARPPEQPRPRGERHPMVYRPEREGRPHGPGPRMGPGGRRPGHPGPPAMERRGPRPRPEKPGLREERRREERRRDTDRPAYSKETRRDRERRERERPRPQEHERDW